jgi:hypothetical protein
LIFEVEKMDVQIVEGWPKGNEIRMLLTNTDAAQVNQFAEHLSLMFQNSLSTELTSTKELTKITKDKFWNQSTYCQTKLLRTDWQ